MAQPVGIKEQPVEEDSEQQPASHVAKAKDKSAGEKTAIVPRIWGKASKVGTMPIPGESVEQRSRRQQAALLSLALKPPKMCSKLTCDALKQGKQAQCSLHRCAVQNILADAERQKGGAGRPERNRDQGCKGKEGRRRI